jgi:hypothetical protein
MWSAAGNNRARDKKKPHFPALQPHDSIKPKPSWEVNRSSASQGSRSVLNMCKIYCRVYKNPLATRILSQNKEVHNIPP